jgi:hypothetical protein
VGIAAGASRSRGVLCFLSALLACALALNVVARLTESAMPEAPSVTAMNPLELHWTLAGFAPKPGSRRIALFGDSLLMTTAGTKDAAQPPANVAATAARQLWRRARVETIEVVRPGLGPQEFWMIADRVGALGPDLALVEFNPLYLSAARGDRNDHEMAALLPASRWPWAVLELPLARLGLSLDTMIAWRTAHLAGTLGRLARLQRTQVRATDLYRQAGHEGELYPLGSRRPALWRLAHGVAVHLPDGRVRPSLAYAHAIFDPTMKGASAEDPAFQALAATIGILRGYGSEVVVFVPPRNVAYLRSIGAWNESGAARTLATLRSVVTTAGGRLGDFHDLLPDQAFCDHADHLCPAERADGIARLAEALVAAVLDGTGGAH